jgi:hypothetical protein
MSRLVPAWTLAESDAPGRDGVWMVKRIEGEPANMRRLTILPRLMPVDPAKYRTDHHDTLRDAGA